MGSAVALANNDVAFVAWSYDDPIDACLGFAVYRQAASQATPTPLPAWVGWEGESNPNWQPQTTEIWPVQKFSWRDLTASPGATYTYTIVPMVGGPGALQGRHDLKLVTNEVTLTPRCSEHIRAYFNRGILSTQHLVHSLPQGPGGGPSNISLLDHIQVPGDPLRMSLAGQQIEALTALLIKAIHDGGHVNGALYELNDAELIGLLDTPGRTSLVLSNAGNDKDPVDGTNAAARARLHEDGIDVTDRILGSGHIGHDKFLVYSDTAGAADSVLTGSTNWTYTGLCAQSNNALILEDADLADCYLDFWGRLEAECPPGERATQSDELRSANDTGHDFTVDGSPVRIWFSPNTKQHSKPPKDQAKCPDDLAEVFELIRGANQGILFLLFQPGAPSVLDVIEETQANEPGLFVRGAATDPDAIGEFETRLHQRPGDPVATVAAASAVDDQFGYWQKELLKSSNTAHAIIHDKVVVIDPLSDDCVVVTGSHNLGYRASYNNDENLVIVKGHRRLAEAYAVHVMDVYDHYRWRWLLQKYGDHAWKGLKRTPEEWQGKYFRYKQRDVEFWLG